MGITARTVQKNASTARQRTKKIAKRRCRKRKRSTFATGQGTHAKVERPLWRKGTLILA